MPVIRPWLNGAADYTLGLGMIIAAPAMGFPRAGMPPALLLVAGVFLCGYSILTDYSLGRFPLIPIRIHRILDVLLGAFIALSPWIFRFADEVWEPHLVFGAALAGVGLFTARRRSREPEPPPVGTPATA